MIRTASTAVLLLAGCTAGSRSLIGRTDLPEGYIREGGFVLGTSIWTNGAPQSRYSVGQVRHGDTHLLVLKRHHGRDEYGASLYRIRAVLELPPLATGETTLLDCTLDGVSRDIIAIGRDAPNQEVAVRAAWLIDITRERFEPLDAAKVLCRCPRRVPRRRKRRPNTALHPAARARGAQSG